MRPKNTILLLLPKKVYLADFSGAQLPKMLSLREKPRSATKISNAVEDAFLGEIVGKNVFIFASEAWVQEMPIAQRVVENLQEKELQQTLSFEAEMFSGIGASDSSVGLQLLGNQEENTVFWLVQLPKNEMQQIEKILQRFGSQLLGVSHPGGLPQRLDPFEQIDAQGNWKRIEFWPDAVICLYAQPNQMPVIHIINCDPRYGNWQNEAQDWFRQLGIETVENILISGSDLSELSRDFSNTVTLEIEAHTSRWLQAWSQHIFLDGFPAYLPLVLPSKLAKRRQIHWKALIVFPLIVFLLGLTIQFLFKKRIELLLKEQQTLQKTTRKLEQVVLDVEQARKQLQALRQLQFSKEDTHAFIQEIFVQHRKRYTELFWALARYVPEDLVLFEMITQQEQILFKGVCLLPHLADEYVKNLKKELDPVGWNVGPATKIILKGSKIWEFQFILKPILVTPRSHSNEDLDSNTFPSTSKKTGQ